VLRSCMAPHGACDSLCARPVPVCERFTAGEDLVCPRAGCAAAETLPPRWRSHFGVQIGTHFVRGYLAARRRHARPYGPRRLCVVRWSGSQSANSAVGTHGAFSRRLGSALGRRGCRVILAAAGLQRIGCCLVNAPRCSHVLRRTGCRRGPRSQPPFAERMQQR